MIIVGNPYTVLVWLNINDGFTTYQYITVYPVSKK